MSDPNITWEPRWLKLERVRQGLNQQDVATKTELSINTITEVERSTSVHLKTVLKVLDALGTTFRQLAERYGE